MGLDMTETEVSDLLISCPRCDRWPMSANLNGSKWGRRNIEFRCPGCGHRENVLIDDQGAISGRTRAR
jgi:hypothetical protein